MPKLFITLVSEQTIPNLQYIKEFGPFDFHYFISTKSMETKDKTRHIVNASDLPGNKFSVIMVNEESLNHIKSKLKDLKFSEEDQLIINCTLGTKIMSIALFDFFNGQSNVVLYYTPIGTNKYVNILNEKEQNNFNTNITIEEYFECYGIKISKKSQCLFDLEQAEIMLAKFKYFKSTEFEILSELRDRRDRKKTSISSIDYLDTFLKKLKFKLKTPGELSRYEVQYITGGWFEEWVYYKCRKLYSINDAQIGLGVVVSAIAENDLDVVFIRNNDLYVIECKTSLGKDLQQATIYKSGALIEKFGRAAKSFLYTIQDLRNNDGTLLAPIDLRCRQQNVTIFDKSDVERMEKA